MSQNPSEPDATRTSPPTLAEALADATARIRVSGSETARLDAELLLGHVLGIDRTGVLAHPDAPLGDGQRVTFEGLVVRRVAGEPVAYIRGIKEFYGLSFAVDPRALIPRPETELIVDLALARVTEALTGSPRPPGSPPVRIADVGTGSGAIAVALAVALRRRGFVGEVAVLATDRSRDALALAVENAVAHAVADVVSFETADLLPPELVSGDRFDLVLANLPYVPSDAVPALPAAASFEPADALDGGADGLMIVRRLLRALPEVLALRGTALLEIGADQADAIRGELEHGLAGWSTSFHEDLGGRTRVVELRATV